MRHGGTQSMIINGNVFEFTMKLALLEGRQALMGGNS